jgi:hypothetical protein
MKLSMMLPRRLSVARGAAAAGLCCVIALTTGGPTSATATSAGAAAAGWKVQPVPIGSWTQSELDGVSCSTARACVGAGGYVDETDNETALAYGWNGQAWKRQPTPSSEIDTGSGINAVSCTGSDACMAVGTVTQTWNGMAWTPRSAPGLSGLNPGMLNGVSCTAADACTAVGYYYPHLQTAALAERWNGKTWKIQPTPPRSAIFTAVSCASADACVAVGSYSTTSANAFPLAESWNGKTWRIEQTPHPEGVKDTFLNGVSCTSATACVAVGDDGTFTDGRSEAAHAFVPLSEVWNGKVWTIKQVPMPAHATAAYLQAVSCGAVSSCTAVGDRVLSATEGDTLAAVWNGKTWRLQATPNPGNDSQLFGVSCRGANVCAAVGSYGSNPDAFAEGEGGL